MNVSRKERRRKRRWYSLVIAWILLGPFLHTYCVLLHPRMLMNGLMETETNFLFD